MSLFLKNHFGAESTCIGFFRISFVFRIFECVVMQSTILSPKKSLEKGEMPPGSPSKLKMWQSSFQETNFAPLQLVPNVREDLVPYNVRAQSSYHDKRPTSSIPENYEKLDFHEKLFYSGRQSPSNVSLIPQSPPPKCHFKNAVLPDYEPRKEIHYGHEYTQTFSPSRDFVDAYSSGASVDSVPLRVVQHQKRGVKLPKIVAGRSPTNICRTYSGGFYSNS